MTMKTYNKEKFLQIMINIEIKKQLDLLKLIISNKKGETFISYGEVINFLIDRFFIFSCFNKTNKKCLQIIMLDFGYGL